MKLYYHKTNGVAEYLTDTFILCDNGHKEGTFEGANYIVRIDSDITKDAELLVTSNNDLLERLKISTVQMHAAIAELKHRKANEVFTGSLVKCIEFNEAAIAKADGK